MIINGLHIQQGKVDPANLVKSSLFVG